MNDIEYNDNLAAQLSIKTEIGRKALALALRNIQTLDKKQQDYGPDNIAKHGEFGVLVRCDDKTARLANLLKQDRPQNESQLDSWLDLANYGLIGAMCHLNQWSA
jgi:hypothetical protein